MASFFEELWNSVFVAGTTPTLLLATNVTFGALQVVLATLLWATSSVHFVILSALCAGLWWSINWFARELRVHQEQEAAKAQRARETATIGTDDSETEVEDDKSPDSASKSPQTQPLPATDVSTSHEVEPLEVHGELKRRAGDTASQGTKSSASTEDEWEKVSESENDKDK